MVNLNSQNKYSQLTSQIAIFSHLIYDSQINYTHFGYLK
ncbi:hypothetical protein SEEN176_05621 [Salmonella enterica subsp. enterica serovar Newport str. CVM 4176]|nr:hypothetical protein SEEN176_05621 [Salmonella enterica subsp. enterica serovar Newport str. CVM 4176]